MKNHSKLLILAASALLMAGCAGGQVPSSSEAASSASSEAASIVSKSSESVEPSSESIEASSEQSQEDVVIGGYNITQLQKTYGEFSLVAGDGSPEDATVTYDGETNTYHCSISPTAKATYVATGFFFGHIVIGNAENDTANTFGARLELNGACVLSNDESDTISYLGAKKAFTVASSGETIVAALGETSGCAVSSANNLELAGSGTLSLESQGSHAGKSGGDFRVYDYVSSGGNAFAIKATASSDGFHGQKFLTNNGETEDYKGFSGSIEFKNIGKQAIDMTTKGGKGAITVDEGVSIVIDGAKNVATCDKTMTVAGSIVATNVSDAPVVATTEGALALTVTGTFTVNGEAVPSQTL